MEPRRRASCGARNFSTCPAANRSRALPLVAGWVLTAGVSLWGELDTARAREAASPPVAKPPIAAQAVVVPDSFLRRWDPITVFFPRDVGPHEGGPEREGQRFAELQPAHPGTWRWLDARTLQFSPAQPWPVLARLTLRVGGTTVPLVTLLEEPLATVPADGAEGLPPVESVTLSFADPVDVTALAAMVEVELRPLPGVEAEGSRLLKGSDDITVKVVERSGRSSPAVYVLNFRQPIPLGTRAQVRLRQGLDDAPERFMTRFSFATAEPFRVVAAGCAAMQVPLTVAGSRYGAEQALRCEADAPRLVVRFSSPPRELGPVEARNLLRLSPSVEDLEYRVTGTTLEVTGRFAREVLYRVAIVPTPCRDEHGRPLRIDGESQFFLSFPAKSPFLQWEASSLIVERFGPQMVPVAGRGDERVDLRIYRIDPWHRGFWPFPARPVHTDDAERPPGPGEEPLAPSAFSTPPDEALVAEHIRTLGSPLVSVLHQLPLSSGGPGGRFGLDLAPYFAKASGPAKPGTYLVGMRRLGAGSQREWIRVQVTDLSLTTVEEAEAVVFAVTSLATGRPVPGAKVKVEGLAGESQGGVHFEGVTGPEGTVRWVVPPKGVTSITRLSASKDSDVVILDPRRPPDGFANGRWQPSYGGWLHWTQYDVQGRRESRRLLCHLFTERPVYRPEETVHIKGWVRERFQGRLKPWTGSAMLVVEGPGDNIWRFPVAMSAVGGFCHAFSAEDLPTGEFTASLVTTEEEQTLATVSFRTEAYRVPEFEVRLHAPDRVPLDGEFQVRLQATYYAGGRVAGRPVRWRVTQFPYQWQPKAREGFAFSTETRFAGAQRFEGRPRWEEEALTDQEGGAVITLNPAAEPTAQPRTYVVEATVVGADDETVTAVQQVVAVPPFVVGLKVPRVVSGGTVIPAEVLLLGVDDAPAAGVPITVRLKHRQWHSVLRASDFSSGQARYLTDVVDEPIAESVVVSGSKAVAVPLAVQVAGVYLVEVEARDRLGRTQRVSLDLFVAGPEPVAWPRPTEPVFTVATDKQDYEPGEEARLVFESPFQNAQALMVVEAPDGPQYRWVEVRGGAATVSIPVLPTYVPRLAVHTVLMRGRLEGTSPSRGATTDLGKPATLAATTWVKVRPVSNRVVVTLTHPPRAVPGGTVDVTVQLADPQGRPLGGEVALWLVDAAVLALGREQPLDPLPDFIDTVPSRLVLRDTRNLVPGDIPFAELPGGDEGEEGELFERATVRRLFVSVPYFNPALQVGRDGTATVRITLPANVTVFKVRAKAVAGGDRFGFATSQLAVRLPLVVQPALPRFVRPGDHFRAAAVGRVVEGEGGAGRVQWQVEGVRLEGPTSQPVSWVATQPLRLEVPARISAQAAKRAQEPSRVTFRVAVERSADAVRDAFEVQLPVRPDRQRTVLRSLATVAPGGALPLPAIPEAVRPGTVRRTLVVSEYPALVRMAAGLSFVMAYPYGCTEQRLSTARVQLALGGFRQLLAQEGGEEQLRAAVRDTIDWLGTTLTPEGLVPYWPAGRGYVSLTAWAVQFLVEAREAGFTVPNALLERLLQALERALRSDYRYFINGASFAERAWALLALAQAGRAQPAYAAELARRAQFLGAEGVATTLHALARTGEAGSPAARQLAGKLWESLVFRLHQGKEIYGGLRTTSSPLPALILPSETRTVAEVTRALLRVEPTHPRLPLLTDALITSGRDNGWGSTNANSAAIVALTERLRPPFAGAARRTVQVELDGRTTLELGPDAPLAVWQSDRPGAGEVRVVAGAAGPVEVRWETSWVGAEDGSQATATAQGFAVRREVQRWRGEEQPLERFPLEQARTEISLGVGEVVEEHVQVVNPADRAYVAVVVPLAAGLEPLNPALATAPPEAQPRGQLTLAPTYTAFLDDHVAFYYDWLPKGSYDFYFRTRATVVGEYVQPPARTEMMYDAAVWGQSAGARVVVQPGE